VTPQFAVDSNRRVVAFSVMVTLILLVSVLIAALGATQQPQSVSTKQVPVAAIPHGPWFAPYVDVTATPTYAFDQQASTRSVVLSFIVSKQDAACTPTWGGIFTLPEADSQLGLGQNIANLEKRGGSVVVSFGGQAGNELAVGCTNTALLEEAYRSVVSTYNIGTIDLDIEGTGVGSTIRARRAAALAALQQSLKSVHKNLAVWITLPVEPTGLDAGGLSEVAQLLAAHVDLTGVNVMTFDFGSGLTAGQTMLSDSESALSQTHQQLETLYQAVGMPLSSEAAWSMIGATAMIGQNDNSGEIFTLSDATGLNQFTLAHGVGRMSMWSANRDVACGPNQNTKVASDTCSGVPQTAGSFAKALASGFEGHLN
jgi:chitinase